MEKLVPTFILLIVTGTRLVYGTLDCDASCLLSNQFDLDIKVDGSDIDLQWTFNKSKQVYGFQMIIYNNDDDKTYESPILHCSQRSMSLEHEIVGETNICLVVYENSTEILDKKCDKIEMKDLKIIIGILAGTIFLIPCIAGLSYVIYKDYKVRLVQQYDKMEPVLEVKRNNIEVVVHIDEENNPESIDKVVHIEEEKNAKSIDKKSTNRDTAEENMAFVHDEDVPQPSKAEHSVSETLETENVSRSEGPTDPATEILEVNNNVQEDSTACSDKDSEKTEKNLDLHKDGDDNLDAVRQATDKLEEYNKVKDKLEVDNVCVTDDDLSGTTL